MRIYADWPLRIQIRNTAQNLNLLSAVLWIGTILFLIQIRISMLVPSQIQKKIRIGIKTRRILMGILPWELYMLENQILLFF